MYWDAEAIHLEISNMNSQEDGQSEFSITRIETGGKKD